MKGLLSKLFVAVSCAGVVGDVVAAKCCEPPLAGTYGDLVIINYSDVDRAASTVENGVITEIVLKEGARAYLFDTLEDSIEGSFSLEAGTWVKYMNHQVLGRFFTKTQEGKDWLNSMLCSRVIALVHNKEAGAADTQPGDAPGMLYWEAYGWEAGLILTALDGSTTMEDGVYAEYTLASGDTSKERSLPKTVWYGTVAETQTAVEALYTPAAPEA